MIQNNLSKFAQKKFGQNFLKNRYYIDKIIQSMPDSNLRVAEIGPGLGDLTKELVKAKCVTAFEVDKRLCKYLQETFALDIESSKLNIRCGDVLEQWKEEKLLDEPYHLVANLPYYIATNIILKALRDPNCRFVLVMVQKEVAQKFSALPGQKEFSALSVLAQSAGEAKLCFDVEAEAFVPPPKVTSAVLLITKNKTLSDEKFELLLRAAFTQPRKKLLKNLSVAFGKDTITDLFKNLQLQENIRPHEATTSIYHQIYNELKDILDGQQPEQRRVSK